MIILKWYFLVRNTKVTSSIRLSSSHRNIKCTVLCQTLTRVESEWNWQAHPVTNGHNVLPSSHTVQTERWAMPLHVSERRLRPEESTERPDSSLITGHCWMIQSGSLAPQPSAKTCPSLCVTPISCTRMMRDEGICHHLHHSTETELKPVMGLGPVMSTGSLQRECGRIFFFFLHCKQKSHFQFVRKEKNKKEDYCCYIKSLSSFVTT